MMSVQTSLISVGTMPTAQTQMEAITVTVHLDSCQQEANNFKLMMEQSVKVRHHIHKA